ncbi:MAG: HD domain-containing protein [Bacilli bacterium]
MYKREGKMTVSKEIEFNNIVNDILKNDAFIDLKYEIHHGISRMQHSLSVAKVTFLICKKTHIKNYEETIRAALLHDFFKTNEITSNAFLNHPEVATKNAIKYFNIDDFQKNIIMSHMFPMCKEMPKSKESVIVSLADKAVAIYECTKYKVPLQLGATLLFLFNVICIQR